MVHGQVAVGAVLAVAGVDARIGNGRVGQVDFRPTDAVDRAAAGVTGDGADAPGGAVAILEVLRPEVTAVDPITAARAEIGHGNRHSGRHAGVGLQVDGANLAQRTARERIGPRPDAIGLAVVVSLGEEVVRAAARPRPLRPAVKVQRLRRVFGRWQRFRGAGRGLAVIHGPLVEGPHAGLLESAGAEDIGPHVDGVAADAGVGVVEEVAAAGRGEGVDVPSGRRVGRLRDGDAVVETVGVDAQNVPVGFLVVEGVGVENAGAVRVRGEKAGEGRRGDKRLARFIVDLEGHIHHGDDVVGADGEFRVGRDVTAAAAALRVADAVKACAGRGRRVDRWSTGKADVAARPQPESVGAQALHPRLGDDAFVLLNVDLAPLPAVKLVVGVVNAGGDRPQVHRCRVHDDAVGHGRGVVPLALGPPWRGRLQRRLAGRTFPSRRNAPGHQPNAGNHDNCDDGQPD